MTLVTDISRAYRPLNGEDAIEAILLELRTALRNSGMFPLHRVWHEFEFQGGVRVKGWATKTEEVKFAGGVEVGEVAPAEGSELVDGKVAASLRGEPPSVTRGRIIEAQRVAQAQTKIAMNAIETALTDSKTVFTCTKCGRPSRTKAGKSAHERHCKVKENADEVSIPRNPSNISSADEGQSSSDQGADAA